MEKHVRSGSWGAVLVAVSLVAWGAGGCSPGEPATGAQQHGTELEALPGERGSEERVLLATAYGAREVVARRIHGQLVLQGDILIHPSQVLDSGALADSQRAAQGAAIHAGSRWPDGIIPYVLDPALSSTSAQSIQAAIAHWNQNTLIQLVPRTTQPDYVLFKPGTSCASNMGKTGSGGEQYIIAGSGSGCSTGAMIHEIGHTVGLFHEQSRADRDAHVNIHWANIDSFYTSEFQTYLERGWSGSMVGWDLGPYDFSSIMHYGSYYASINGQPTITKKSGELITAQTASLSPGDIDSVRELYEGNAPAVTRLRDSTQLVRAVRKLNGLIYVTASDAAGNNWQSEALAATERMRYGPAITSSAVGRFDLFAVGMDYALHHRYYANGAWSPWVSLGGYLTAAPAVVSRGPNLMDVVVRGANNTLFHNAYTGTGWTGWNGLGGATLSAPTLSSWASDRLDVFVRGTDNGLYQNVWLNGAWSGWMGLGGPITSGPAAVSWGVGRVDVFARGTDGAIYQKAWTGSAWTTWMGLGGYVTASPAVTSRGANRLDLFVRGVHGNLYRNSYETTYWTSWQGLTSDNSMY